MFKSALLVSTLALPAVAFAQDVPTPPTAAPAVTGNAFQHGTLGISLAIPGASPGFQTDLTYFSDEKTAFDIFVGFDLLHTSVTDMAMPPVTTTSTVFKLSAGFGYRMYKPVADRLHTYLEPFGILTTTDIANIGDNIVLQAGGAFGVECMLTDWFSIRGQVGAELLLSNKFKNIEFGTIEGLFANVYWK